MAAAWQVARSNLQLAGHVRAYSTRRTYQDAVGALNTLQSNFAVVNAIRQSGRGMNKQAIPEMLDWLRRAGYSAHEFNPINAVHIAGTKGKGSTAAFVASILNQYRLAGHKDIVRKVGLYTSPHLRFVRERIQINGQPLTEEEFTESFFEVWDRLEQAQAAEPPIGERAKPMYFRYLTIMAFHTYLQHSVDAAVIECGIGGEYDSTNVLQSPVAAGITSLGIDHVATLGSTIGEIAWHKAGIMKPGVPAFTSPQPQEALDVLHSRAEEKGVTLKVVEMHPEVANGKAILGLNGEFQKANASLAIELAAQYLRSRGRKDLSVANLPEEFLRGLKEVCWAGRCEIRDEPGLTWCIDGAHTLESIRVTAEWYSSVLNSQKVSGSEHRPRILLFNQQTRAGLPLLEELFKVVKDGTKHEEPFTHAIFCTNVTYSASGYRPDLLSMNVDAKAVQDLQVQKEFAADWQKLTGKADTEDILVVPTIEEAVKTCRELTESWRREHPPMSNTRPTVLATGSIHLIGGLMDVLEQAS